VRPRGGRECVPVSCVIEPKAVPDFVKGGAEGRRKVGPHGAWRAGRRGREFVEWTDADRGIDHPLRAAPRPALSSKYRVLSTTVESIQQRWTSSSVRGHEYRPPEPKSAIWPPPRAVWASHLPRFGLYRVIPRITQSIELPVTHSGTHSKSAGAAVVTVEEEEEEGGARTCFGTEGLPAQRQNGSTPTGRRHASCCPAGRLHLAIVCSSHHIA
jgi:hypothetical protein